jgi:hypothetical protein
LNQQIITTIQNWPPDGSWSRSGFQTSFGFLFGCPRDHFGSHLGTQTVSTIYYLLLIFFWDPVWIISGRLFGDQRNTNINWALVCTGSLLTGVQTVIFSILFGTEFQTSSRSPCLE